MSDDPPTMKPRGRSGGRPRVHPANDEAAVARKRETAKAHHKAVRAVTVAKTANLTPETAARAEAMQKRRGLRSFTALVTVLVDDAHESET